MVAVLVGVPALSTTEEESTSALLLKTKKWCDQYCAGNDGISSNIIMARRVRWVGSRPKNIEGDCIIVNFNKCNVADRLFWDASELTKEKGVIRALPLGFFYPPGIGTNALEFRMFLRSPHCLKNNSRGASDWETIIRRETAAINSPVKSAGSRGNVLPLSNRFSPLSQLDEND